VAEQAAEGDEVSSTAFTLDYLTVDVKTFGGGERISRQLIERSDPAFLDRLIIEMGAQYAQATDKWAHDQINAAFGAGQESNGSTIYAALTKGIVDSYEVMRFMPNRLVVAPTTTGSIGFDDLLGAVGSDNRPLFAAAAPQNAAGLLTQGTTQGTVAGLDVVVDANLDANEEAWVLPSAAATFYESAGSPVQISVQDVSSLEVEVAVYGYVALAIKYLDAIRYVTVTP